MRARRHWGIASVLLIAMLFAACGSSGSKKPAAPSGPTTAVDNYKPSTTLGVGVTPTEIKVGI
jgi:hypothetical protein